MFFSESAPMYPVSELPLTLATAAAEAANYFRHGKCYDFVEFK